MNSEVSILIPAYNAEEHIVRALDGIKQQTFPAHQVIVVDDGSTDSTVDVVNEWSQSNAIPVDVFSKQNAGAASARNYGFQKITGQLVALLDADDWMYPQHLETLVKPFEKDPNVVLAFGRTEVRDSGSEAVIKEFPGEKIYDLVGDSVGPSARLLQGSVFESLIWGSFIGVSATLFSREAGEKIGWMDEEIFTSEDQDFFLRLSRVGTFAYCPSMLSIKYEHEENATHDKYALRTSVGEFRLLKKMLDQAGSLELSDAEIATTRAALKQASRSVLYQASRKGVGEYAANLDAVRKAGRPPIVSCIRGAARAMLESLKSGSLASRKGPAHDLEN